MRFLNDFMASPDRESVWIKKNDLMHTMPREYSQLQAPSALSE